MTHQLDANEREAGRTVAREGCAAVGETSVPRTTLRRHPERGTHDRSAVEALLDGVPIVHVGVVTDRGPLVLPMAHGRVGDRLYLHGARQNGLLRHRTLCVEATILDGLVLAKSAFHHSMNYRSVVVFGEAYEVEGEEKVRALDAIVNHVLPGRAAESRPSSVKEMRATQVLGMKLAEASVKKRDGGPKDDPSDLSLPHWHGVLPLRQHWQWPTHGATDMALPGTVATALQESTRPLDGTRTLSAAGAHYVLHGDASTMDLDRVQQWLEEESYWARDMNRQRLLRSLDNSRFALVHQVTEPESPEPQLGPQVAIARVITDGVTMAWLGDVFVDAAHRGRGLGDAMTDYLVTHAEFHHVRRWLLGSRDAHRLYAKHGFEPVPDGRFMQRMQG